MALCAPVLALAQALAPEPAVPGTPARPLQYRSAFADYKPWQDIEPGNWRRLNDNLAPASGRPGAHDGRGAEPAAPDAQAPAPATRGHRGHRMHGHRP